MFKLLFLFNLITVKFSHRHVGGPNRALNFTLFHPIAIFGTLLSWVE